MVDKSGQKGFSLTEILITISIVGALALVAGTTYYKAKDAPFKAMQKLELTEINKALHFARQVDGGYHQKIFTAGYRPSKLLSVGAGFGYSKSDAICCQSKGFPLTAQEAKSKASKFFTLHKDIYDSTKVESSIKASHICGMSKHCTLNRAGGMQWVGGGQAVGHDGAGDPECMAAFQNNALMKCTCHTFLISSRRPVRRRTHAGSLRAYMNEEGLFCRWDKNPGHTLRSY